MAKAGYCAECGSTVWVLDDGTCQNGHPASSVSGIYDAEPVTAPPAFTAPATGAKRLSRRAVVVIIVVLVALVALGGVVAIVAKPFANKGVSIAAEWQARLAKDYPGWKAIGFNVRSFSGSGRSETEYAFTLVPPDRDFSVAVVYLSENGGPANSQDEVSDPPGHTMNGLSHCWTSWSNATWTKTRTSQRSRASPTGPPP